MQAQPADRSSLAARGRPVWRAYRLAERAGAPSMDINDVLLVMLLAYVVGVVVARRRYS